ncbi:MAG: F(420)H(2) dehydrogenase subunit N [Candidatus Heimdallarchaeota archaeon LC_3]|nr:MAG: F(420)H(2) dehydrogenase subunit N [Candidatus Heimdallarchaeota archaeon LC_3]
MQEIVLGIISEDIFAFSWVLIILAGVSLILLLEYINIHKFHTLIGIATLALATGPMLWYLTGPGQDSTSFFFGFSESGTLNYINSLLVIDYFTAFLGLIFLITNLLVLIASLEFMKKEDNMFIFTTLMLLATLGMVFVGSSIDVIALVVAWELVSIPSYILVAFRKGERESTEGAIKFFIVGAVSSALMLFGASLLFGLVNPVGLNGSPTNYYVIMDAVTSVSDDTFLGFVLVGIGMVVAGLGFKMGTVPFHWWLPDAYESALTPITTMLAAASKKVGFAAGFRILLVPLLVFPWANDEIWEAVLLILAFVAIFTMIVGNVGALVQMKMKRLLAYSSIGQAGYIMLTIASAGTLSFQAGLYHVFAHTFMIIGAFVCVMIVTSRTGTDDIEDYKGLYNRMPLTAMALTLTLLSLAGIPPLIGFASKLWIFLGALQNASINPILYWAALIMVITSAISVYYYVRIIKFMLMDKSPDHLTDEMFVSAPRVSLAYAFPLIITTLVVALFGLFAGITIPVFDTSLIEFLNEVQKSAWEPIKNLFGL